MRYNSRPYSAFFGGQDEQREDAPLKVQPGVVAVPYKLCNANPDHMRLQELLKHDREGRDLRFSEDIQPSLSQLGNIQHQFIAQVQDTIRIIACTYSTDRDQEYD
jgi:hypothetical protein